MKCASDAAPPIKERLCRLLGPNAVERLTTALQSSGPRFAALRRDNVEADDVQPIVTVLAELFEVLAAADITEQAWPHRWHNEASSAEPESPQRLRQRAFAVLGDFATTRLSRAIGKGRERIQHAWGGTSPRLATDLAAVVELLEVVAANGGDLPPRWGTGGKSTPAPRLARAGPEPYVVKSRFVEVLGDGVSSRLARAIDAKPDYIRATFAGRQNGNIRSRPRPAVIAILELLELLKAEGIPEDRWPERWRRAERRPPGRRRQIETETTDSPATTVGQS